MKGAHHTRNDDVNINNDDDIVNDDKFVDIDLSDLERLPPISDQENNDIALVADVMRLIASELDKEDVISLARVNAAWQQALQENVNEVWTNEWLTFKAKNQGASWFVDENSVYSLPLQESIWSNKLNKCRRLVGKDSKSFQSLRQMTLQKRVKIDNPNPIQLLIANGQAKMAALNQDEWDRLMQERPMLRVAIGKFACALSFPVLIALGIGLLPLTAVAALAAVIYRKASGNQLCRGGGPLGGIGELVLIAAPTGLPWAGAFVALSFVTSTENLRHVPKFYQDFKSVNEKMRLNTLSAPKSESDLKVNNN